MAWEDFRRRTYLALAAGVLLVIVLGGAGWLIHSAPLAAGGRGYVPIAPATLLAFLLTAAGLLLAHPQPSARRRPWLLAAAVTLSAFAAFLLLATALGPPGSTALLFRAPGAIFSHPAAGRVSPFTAACFLLCSAGLAALGGWGPRPAWTAPGSGLALLAIQLSVLLGYAYDVPFLYAGRVTPIALPTALAFVLTGGALALSPVPGNGIIGALTGPSVRAKLLRVFVPIAGALAGCVALSGWFILGAGGNAQWVTAAAILVVTALVLAATAVAADRVGRSLDEAGAERDRALAAVKRREDDLRTLLANLGEGVAVVDFEETFLFGNPAAERIFGVEAGALCGRNIQEFVTPESFDRLRKGTLRRMEGEVESYDLKIRRPDGEERIVAVTASPHFDADGSMAGVLGIFMDITERMEMEEARRIYETRALKLRHLEETGRLIQGLAHEVRNPLFAIQANVAALAKRPAEEARSFLPHILEHGKRLGDLIRDLIELAQPTVPSEFTDCRLALLLEEAASQAADGALLDRRRLLLSGDLPDVTIRASSRKVTHAFAHLMKNALEHSGADLPVHVTGVRAGGDMVIQITDRGAGLPKRLQESLFEPFVTTRVGHRGLGLALARHYIEAGGGSITAADNDPPPGATFTVRLPLNPAGPGELREGPAGG